MFFHSHGADASGAVFFSKQLRRNKVLEFFARQSPYTVAMEACVRSIAIISTGSPSRESESIRVLWKKTTSMRNGKAEQVWNAMHKLLPIAPDPVVTHGDLSLDNLLKVDGIRDLCAEPCRWGHL